jgi:hypothetical protein
VDRGGGRRGLAALSRKKENMTYLLQEDFFDLSEFTSNKENLKGNQNCDIGTISELQFMVEAAKNGFTIFTPIGHSQKADVVVWKKPNKPISVQIKKGLFESSGNWKISTSSKKPSCMANKGEKGSLYTNYVDGDFDVLAAHIVESGCWALWRLKDIAGQSSIRWDGSPKNNFELLEHIK